MVGETLPGTVTYYPVPDYGDYSFTILNGRRVIVERRTHRIVRIIE